MTAVPNTGYDFAGWTGGVTGTVNPLTITNVTSDMAITAENIDAAKAEEARRRAEARLAEKLDDEETAVVSDLENMDSNAQVLDRLESLSNEDTN